MPSFVNTVKKLLTRVTSDRVDSIRIEAQGQLRNIIRDLSTHKEDLTGLLNHLSVDQVTTLKRCVDFEETVNRIDQILDETQIMSNAQAIELHQFQKKLMFGAIPKDIVERVKKSGDDRLMKLRAVQDLDSVFDNIFESNSTVETIMLVEYASQFLEFLDTNLLQDESGDIKYILAALKGIKLIVNPKTQNLGAKLNLNRLAVSLLQGLNDSKELVRSEMQQLLIEL